jgi:uncharacterized protein YidB (DUF937 family)
VSGIDDLLGGLLGGKGGVGGNKTLAMLLPVVGGLLAGGGLEKLLGGFKAKGLSAQADSWVGTGENEPITGEQVRGVVGDDEVAQVAQQLGVSQEEAAQGLAEVLPQVIDKASPEGQLLPQGELDSAFEQLQQSAAGATG